MRAVGRRRDDSRVVRAKDVKRPWIGMQLRVVDYQNRLGLRCDADSGTMARRPTAEVPCNDG
jgi:hypothetical protein